MVRLVEVAGDGLRPVWMLGESAAQIMPVAAGREGKLVDKTTLFSMYREGENRVTATDRATHTQNGTSISFSGSTWLATLTCLPIGKPRRICRTPTAR